MGTKKRLFFLLFSMNVGGVEKSFLSLLDTLSPDEYEIHVGLLRRQGGFMDMLPSWVIVHDCCQGCWKMVNKSPSLAIRNSLKKGRLILALKLLSAWRKYDSKRDLTEYYDVILKNEPEIPEVFDAAYAYAGPATIIDYYICRKVHAKNKYGWIHFDVGRCGAEKAMIRILYKEYDKIYVVSEAAKAKFDKYFPEYKDKTEVRYNIVSKEQVWSLSKSGETYDDDFDGIRILTVGRLSREKGQDATIRTLRILVDKGLDARWYYVGDGDLSETLRRMSEEEGLSDRVVFLGIKPNPYGYMRDCDIYVQPSRHEGYCITLAEAKCFSVPIVSTNFTGAAEQLKTYPKSVVTGMSAEEMADGIMTLLK